MTSRPADKLLRKGGEDLGFNLIAEPWVPVVQAGRYREASPLEALSTPGLVLAAHPYEEAPVLRFLLYLLAWAFQGEDEEEVAELPPEAWRERVEELLEELEELLRKG